MRRPEVDEILRVLDPEALGLGQHSDAVQVIAVFGSLGEDWGIWGEHAWSQADHDTETGHIGDWYVIAVEVRQNAEGETEVVHEGETFSLASYEVGQ
jgi:hypothetical protein